MTEFLLTLGLCLGLPFLVGLLIANTGGMTRLSQFWKWIWDDEDTKRDA